jgi:hypothetical protein
MGPSYTSTYALARGADDAAVPPEHSIAIVGMNVDMCVANGNINGTDPPSLPSTKDDERKKNKKVLWKDL